MQFPPSPRGIVLQCQTHRPSFEHPMHAVALSGPASWVSLRRSLGGSHPRSTHIMPMLEVWLTSQVASLGGDAGHVQPLPPPTAPAPLPSGVPANPVPSSFLTSLTEIRSSSRSPFAAQHSAPALRGAAVSNPLSRQLHPAARAPDTAWSTS